MSLFISNFKNEAKVLATIAAVLLVSETTIRVLLPRVSTDWRNFEAIANLTAGTRTGQQPRVLFLGNSLTGRSIVPSVVQTKIEAEGFPVSVQKIATDDSNITEWLYLSRGKLGEPNSRPDLLVVGYAEDQLSDRAPVHVDRLAGYYGGLRIASEVFREDVHDFGSRTDFVLSSMSVLYANRDRVRNQLLDTLVPGYRTLAQETNRAAKSSGATRTAPRYERLKRLLAFSRANSIGVALVAMPIPYQYRIDADVHNLAHEYDAAFFDMTGVSTISGRHYSDGYHLDDTGAHIYSESFARVLVASDQVLSKILERNKGRSVAGL
jgi:hypothetical protein